MNADRGPVMPENPGKLAADAASSADRLAVVHPLGKGCSGPVESKSKRNAKRHLRHFTSRHYNPGGKPLECSSGIAPIRTVELANR
ncbi:hypothetical protein [Stieleria maiorica]|uniref:hypothetical protein n=1 Tax=Stieleria maiorica TaxID=2795974 RepID=UPI0011C836C9|nr:hypothetical protein [Stieleria maiorica]